MRIIEEEAEDDFAVIPLDVFDPASENQYALFRTNLIGFQGRSQGLIRQQVIEIGDRLNKTFIELGLRGPGEFLSGHGNVRTPLARVVLRKRLVDDLGG